MAQPQIDDATVFAVQQHMAQQAAFSQIPDVVKAVSFIFVSLSRVVSANETTSSLCIFTKLWLTTTLQRSQLHTRVVGINIPKSSTPEQNGQRQILSPPSLTMVNDQPISRQSMLTHRIFFFPDQIFLILYRELYYRHVYSRLQPNIDDRFHSYENSCELFNYLLSAL